MRASWEMKKERLSFRKKNIKEFVWGISFFYCTSFFLSFFCCLCLLFFAFLNWRNSQIATVKKDSTAMGGILSDDIMSERLKIWKSSAIYFVVISKNVILFQTFFSFSCSGYHLILIEMSRTWNCYSFSKKFLIKTKT